MSNKRTKLLKWGQDFIKKMKKNDIWFSADIDMILGAQRHGGFIPWNERIQVIMTPESYIKLQRLFPENVINSYYSKKYKSFKAAFIKNRDEWEKDQPFIEIRIIVPTTIKKIKRFRSRIKFISKILTGRKETTKSAINELFDYAHEGFYVIDKRFTPAIKCWIPNVSFQMEEMKFNNLIIPVIKEWEYWLIANYTSEYMKAVIPPITYTYPAPLKISREEK